MYDRGTDGQKGISLQSQGVMTWTLESMEDVFRAFDCVSANEHSVRHSDGRTIASATLRLVLRYENHDGTLRVTFQTTTLTFHPFLSVPLVCSVVTLVSTLYPFAYSSLPIRHKPHTCLSCLIIYTLEGTKSVAPPNLHNRLRVL